MANFIRQFFTWWSGNTINTRFFTWRHGTRVGEDEFGNVYYEGDLHKEGYKRRWVIYKNYSEGSFVPPGWHGWLHRRVDVPPSAEDDVPYPWQKAHHPNLTATDFAHHPQGSLKDKQKRKIVSADYQPWSPE